MRYIVYSTPDPTMAAEIRERLGGMAHYWNGEVVKYRYFHFWQWLRGLFARSVVS